MSLHRYNAKRDKFEWLYVQLWRKAGITVKRNSVSGEPDCLLTKAGHEPVEVEVKTAKNFSEAWRKRTTKQVEYWDTYSKIKNLRMVWDFESAMAVIKECF